MKPASLIQALATAVLLFMPATLLSAGNGEAGRQVRVVRDTETIQAGYVTAESGLSGDYGYNGKASTPGLFHCYLLETSVGESWEITSSYVDGGASSSLLARVTGPECRLEDRITEGVHGDFKGILKKRHVLRFTAGGGAYWVVTNGPVDKDYVVGFKRRTSSSSAAIESGAEAIPAALVAVSSGGVQPGPIAAREPLHVATEKVFAKFALEGVTWVDEGRWYYGDEDRFVIERRRFGRGPGGTLRLSSAGLPWDSDKVFTSNTIGAHLAVRGGADFVLDTRSEMYRAHWTNHSGDVYETDLFSRDGNTLAAVSFMVDKKGGRTWHAYTSYRLSEDGYIQLEEHVRFGGSLLSLSGNTYSTILKQWPDGRLAELDAKEKRLKADRQAAIAQQQFEEARRERERSLETIRRQNALAGVLDGANAIASEQAARSSADLERTLAQARDQARRQQEDERRRQQQAAEAQQRQRQHAQQQHAASVAEGQRRVTQQQEAARAEADRQARARAEQEARRQADDRRIAAGKAEAERQRKLEADRRQALRQAEQSLRSGFSGRAATCIGGGKDVLYLQTSRPPKTGCNVDFEARCPGSAPDSVVRFGQHNYVGGSCMGVGDSIRIGTLSCPAEQVRITMTRADCGSGS